MKPTDVRLRRADGTVLHCELVHLEPDDSGQDRWLIANASYQPGDALTIGLMPPSTSVEFAVDDDCRGVDDVQWDADE